MELAHAIEGPGRAGGKAGSSKPEALAQQQQARGTMGKKQQLKAAAKPKLFGGALLPRRGTQALREIRREQKSTELVFSKKAIKRTICELCDDFTSKRFPEKHPFLWKPEARLALQEAAEKLVVDVMHMARKDMAAAKRETILERDVRRAFRTLQGTDESDDEEAAAQPKSAGQDTQQSQEHTAAAAAGQ